MSNYEYHQFLKFLYFEGYADSYEEAEYLLEELSDEEFEELQEKYVRALDATGRGPDRRAHTTDPTVRPRRLKPMPDVIKHTESGFDRDASRRSPGARRRKTQRRQSVGGKSYTEEYEVIVDYLYNEGYADSYEEAENIIENLNDEELENLIVESGITDANRRTRDRLIRQYGPEFFTNPRPTGKKRKVTSVKSIELTNQEPKKKRTTDMSRVIVAHYLFDEGYAETLDGAEVMAENISEDWVNDILEKFDPKDYKEYHQKNHRDERNQSDEWDAQEKDWQDSRGDIRDKHNMTRGVRKKKGVK
jgi:hypothetical protein